MELPLLPAINKYRPVYIDVKNTIIFAATTIKKYYDEKHTFIYYKVENFVNLRLHKKYKVLKLLKKID